MALQIGNQDPLIGVRIKQYKQFTWITATFSQIMTLSTLPWTYNNACRDDQKLLPRQIYQMEAPTMVPIKCNFDISIFNTFQSLINVQHFPTLNWCPTLSNFKVMSNTFHQWVKIQRSICTAQHFPWINNCPTLSTITFMPNTVHPTLSVQNNSVQNFTSRSKIPLVQQNMSNTLYPFRPWP